MRAAFCHLLYTRFFRPVARVLIFLLLIQNFPVDGLRRGQAEAAASILWVDALGDCRGETPC